MNIKNVGLLAVLVLLFACDKSGGKLKVIVDGQAPENVLVVLYEFTSEGLKALDTLELLEENTYQSKLPEIQKENFYRIDVFKTQAVNLVLDGTEEKVDVTINGSDRSVTGSPKSELVNKIDALLEKSRGDAEQLNQEATAANQMGDEASVMEIIEQYNAMMATQIADLKVLVKEGGASLAAVYGLTFLNMDSEFDFYDEVVSKTYAVMPDHFWIKQLNETLNEMRLLAIGRPAPDFTLNTPEGTSLSLSDLKGKYVLIDFWAAWCKPCRVENPNVVSMYQKYGGAQFEILGVSLDRTQEAWLSAIQEDGLTWKHVSDLQYFNSAAAQLYKINAIPATYLIDPQGNILAKNLRGPSLEAKLEELFGK